MKIIAVVVTFNRLDLLKECIGALLAQSKKPDEIIVVNNGSTDGTLEWLESVEGLQVITQDNTGSAGGQNTGFKEAYNRGADWIWCMDDDVVPKTNALEKLVEASEKNPDAGFLSSLVVGDDNTPMNIPIINMKKNKNHYAGWADKLAKQMIKVKYSTFVSLFVNRAAIERVGFPIKDFFIWNDDYEFTARISQHFENFLVANSEVLHKRVIQAPPGIVIEENKNRIPNYFYLYRNKSFVRKRYEGTIPYLDFLSGAFSTFWVSLFKGKHKLLKAKTIVRGVVSGFFFNPEIEKP